MNNISMLTKGLSFFLLLWILASCNPKSAPNQNLQEDAKKYAALKCEMRLKLEQIRSDTLMAVTEAEVDSLRKVMSIELKKIRSAYESDSVLLNKFEAAVTSEFGKMDECRNLQKQPRQGRQQKSGKQRKGN